MTEKSIYAIYGASGFGREVMPLALIQLTQNSIPREWLVFVDDSEHVPSMINGHQVMRYTQFLEEQASVRHAVLAVADGTVREKLARRYAANGIRCLPLGVYDLQPIADFSIFNTNKK